MASGMTGGQMFGAVIGAAVGFFFAPAGLAIAYASAGMTIGMAVGGIIDPPPQQVLYQEGARLGDLSTQTSEWGTPIPRLFGTYRMAGNIIWSLPLNETKHVEESGGGKGGGGTKTESTWYTYAGSWAVGLCEGEIDGVLKIWFDSILVYDGTDYSGGLNSGNYSIYLGTADQMPDWFIQKTNPDTPAFRHLVYFVFRDIELENYGNRIPRVSVELAETAIPHNPYTTFPVDGVNGTTLVKNSAFNRYVLESVHEDGASYRTSIYRNFYDRHGNLASRSSVFFKYYTALSVADVNLFSDVDCFSYVNGDQEFILTDYEDNQNDILITSGGFDSSVENYQMYYFRGVLYSANRSSNELYTGFGNIGSSRLISFTHHDDTIPADGENTQYGFNSSYIFAIRWYGSESKTLKVFNLNGNLISSTDISPKIAEFITTDVNSCRVFLAGNGIFYVASIFESIVYLHSLDVTDYTFIGSYPIGPEILIGPTGTPAIGGIWYSDGFLYLSMKHATTSQNYISKIQLNGLIEQKVLLSSITESLLLRAGFEAIDFDVTDGVDLVNGYVVPVPMNTRSAITSITVAYGFDFIEVNSKMILRKRDVNPIAVITEEDDVVDFIEIEKRQTVELNDRIVIMYANKDNNYDSGSQLVKRINTNTKNSKTYQFALALTNDEAKVIAERYVYSEWSERDIFNFSLTNEHLNLLPGDAITLVYKGFEYPVRITDVEYTTDNQVKIKASKQNGSVYSSTSIGSDTGNVVYEVDKQTITTMVPLDIPMLDNIYNKEGIYYAISKHSTNWKGSSVHKSIDLGVSYTRVGDCLNDNTIGFTTTKLEPANPLFWDRDNSVTVYSDDVLYASTEFDVLNAESYVSIGKEILQYVDLIDHGDNTYTLSNLLRGRRGTEWAVDTHDIDETFVFLSSDMYFDSTASLNVDTYYKATTFGSFTDDSIKHFIRPEIICLKPFSVSYVRGHRNELNDLEIVWMRRSRDVTGYFNTLTLMEEEEIYEIDILDSGDNVVATKIVNEPTYIYLDADQLLEIPGHFSGADVKLVIYQVSGIVQRGYPSEETL